MAQPYVGEIRIFAGNFAPVGWALCDGTLMSIEENETLFQVIGTTYGGDGRSTFALPDLRSRFPVHQGPNYGMGQSGGVETVTLSTEQMPAHTHPLQASTATGSQASATGAVLASGSSVSLYRAATASAPLAPEAMRFTGGSLPHDNMQPFLCITYIISLYGLYPSPT